MSKTLAEIVGTMQKSYGAEGAIESIMASEWPVETKREAIEMIEGPCRDDALGEGGEVNADEFFH